MFKRTSNVPQVYLHPCDGIQAVRTGQRHLVEHESGQVMEVTMGARGNGQPKCSECGNHCPGYDSMPTAHRFDFIPTWMILVMLTYTMRRVRSHLMKEESQRFQTYTYPACARRSKNAWSARVMQSRIEPTQHVAQTHRRNCDLSLNWFWESGAFSSSVVEGFNSIPTKAFVMLCL